MIDACAIYSQALSSLRRQLSVPEHLEVEDTLASMTALYMYEVRHNKCNSMAHGLLWYYLFNNTRSWLLDQNMPGYHTPTGSPCCLR